jgi:hypothetical protein
MGRECAELTVDFIRQSDKAVCVNNAVRDLWIPKSQIDDPESFDDLRRGQSFTISVTLWFADKEGLT